MSDYEAMMARNARKMAARRKDAFRRLAFTLAVTLAVVLAFVGLEWIGFISKTFLVILAAITVCCGAFRAGYIWRDVKW